MLGNLGVLLQFSAVLLVVPALVGTALGQAGSITGIYLEVVGLSFVYLVMMLFFPEEKLSAWKSVLGGGMLRLKEFIMTLVGNILRVHGRLGAPTDTHWPDCKHLCSFCSVCHDYRRWLFASQARVSKNGKSHHVPMLTANMILGRFEIIAVLYIFFSALRK